MFAVRPPPPKVSLNPSPSICFLALYSTDTGTIARTFKLVWPIQIQCIKYYIVLYYIILYYIIFCTILINKTPTVNFERK